MKFLSRPLDYAALGMTLAATIAAAGQSTGNWAPDLGSSALTPSPPNDIVRDLYASSGQTCYAAGEFTQPGNHLAYWNGLSWESAGATNWLPFESTANAVMEYGSDLYAAGRFKMNDNSPLVLLVKRSSSEPQGTWTPVIFASQQSQENEAYCLEVHDGVLVMGGRFTTDTGHQGIVAWDGSNSSGVGDGGVSGNGTVYTLASHQDPSGIQRLFAGGDFTNIGGNTPVYPDGSPMRESNLAMMSAGQWWDVRPNGADAPVRALCSVSGQGVYAGGNFHAISGVSGLSHVALIDNSLNIHALDSGVDGVVMAISEWNKGIAFGGQFAQAGGSSAMNIANWNPSSGWNGLDWGMDGGFTDEPTVQAICPSPGFYFTGIYAGGKPAVCGSAGDPTSNIAEYSVFQESQNIFIVNWNCDFDMSPERWELSSGNQDQQCTAELRSVSNSFTKIAWDPESLETGEYLGFRLDNSLENIASIDMSIFRPESPGPFLPPVERLDFNIQDISNGFNFSAIAISENGDVIENFPVFEGLNSVDVDGLFSSATTSDGSYLEMGEFFVAGFDQPSTIAINGIIHQNIVAFALRQTSRQGPSGSWRASEMTLQGDLSIDVARSGFGYRNNLNQASGDLRSLTIDQQSSALELEFQDAGVLYVKPVTCILSEESDSNPGSGCINDSAEMGFHVLESDLNAFLSIEAKAGIEVGTPGDEVVDEDCKFTLERSGQSNAYMYFRPSSILQGKQMIVQLLLQDDVIMEYSSVAGATSLEVINAFQDDTFDAHVEFSSTDCAWRWTDPRLIVLIDPHFPGDGHIDVEIDGWRLKNPHEESDPDGDGIADQLKPVSLEVTTQRRMKLRISEQRFFPAEDSPQSEPGDFNGDGKINGADLGYMLGAWGTDDETADLNGDGTVNGADLGLFLGLWRG